jgi:hypothetical protein
MSVCELDLGVLRSKRLPTVTLVSITGVNIHRTVFALWRTSRRLKFHSVVLITDKKIRFQPPWLEVMHLTEFKLDSIDAYSYFCVYELSNWIQTEHALLIQADGYVIRPKLWNPEFLNYDYIGAPWPIVDNSYIDPQGVHQRVGNGGFSLRSRRLLNVPKFFDVVWEINDSNYYKHLGYGLQSEDGIICVHNRAIYEQAGCVFAPLSIAAKFSTETHLPESVKSFGFHKTLPDFRSRMVDFLLRLVFKVLILRLRVIK